MGKTPKCKECEHKRTEWMKGKKYGGLSKYMWRCFCGSPEGYTKKNICSEDKKIKFSPKWCPLRNNDTNILDSEGRNF